MMVLGKTEFCSVLKTKGIAARIDTGATLSSIHATNIKHFLNENGMACVTFRFEGINYTGVLERMKTFKSSLGSEKRPTVMLTLTIGNLFVNHKARVEVSLADRSGMSHKVLIGRNAIGDATVMPSRSYIFTK